MQTIKIKRSQTSTTAPASLATGELAWVDHSNNAGGANGALYIGDAKTGAVKQIGGTLSSSYVTDLLNNTALTGATTAVTLDATGEMSALAPAANAVGSEVTTASWVNNAIDTADTPISQASDVDVTGAANGHVLVYDVQNAQGASWTSRAISGDVSMDKTGATTVTNVQAGTIDMDTDIGSGSFVQTLSGTANEVEISAMTFPNGDTNRGHYQIGLPNDVTITGNLIVNGTSTQVNTNVVTIEDPVFALGSNGSGTATDKDLGIEFAYTDSGNTDRIGMYGYDISANEFVFRPVATETASGSNIYTGAVGNARFDDIAGTLTTASQTAITGLGTITVGTWNADIISRAKGGFGIDTSTWTAGVIHMDGNGVIENTSQLDVSLGGTGVTAIASNEILLGSGGDTMTKLAAAPQTQDAQGNDEGYILMQKAGVASWTKTMDGGSF